MDNVKFKQAQDLIKGIKNRSYRKPVYKFEILKEKSDKLNEEHA